MRLAIDAISQRLPAGIGQQNPVTQADQRIPHGRLGINVIFHQENRFLPLGTQNRSLCGG
jgi:hypothetical protein